MPPDSKQILTEIAGEADTGMKERTASGQESITHQEPRSSRAAQPRDHRLSSQKIKEPKNRRITQGAGGVRA